MRSQTQIRHNICRQQSKLIKAENILTGRKLHQSKLELSVDVHFCLIESKTQRLSFLTFA